MRVLVQTRICFFLTLPFPDSEDLQHTRAVRPIEFRRFAMDDDTAELRNPFPSPPSHYTKYTSHNLKLLGLLKERASDDDSNPNQHEILQDQNDVPDWPLTQLEKPRVDWILEEPDAFYDVFGDRWFVRVLNTSVRPHSDNSIL